jgi:large conductance mechanosensitive channel
MENDPKNTPPPTVVTTKADHFSFITKFILFVRQQGVIGLAVAVVLGGAVQKVVTALVTDILTPVLGIILGQNASLATASVTIGKSSILYGDFISNIIDFFIIAFAIYLLVKVIHADMLDKPKE